MYRTKVNRVPENRRPGYESNTTLYVAKGETGAIRMSVYTHVAGVDLEDIAFDLNVNEAYTLAQALLTKCGDYVIRELTQA